MTVLLLSLLVLAGGFVGAGVTLFLTGPPVDDRRHIDQLARKDRA